MTDALQLLRTDHNEVKELFKQFEQADDSATKGEIARKAIMELDIHAQIEEEIFYPALRRQEDTEKDMLDEADEEHHVAHLLIAELKSMRPSSDRYSAKFTVLAESVKHHIDEEEQELFPLAAEEGAERLELLGGRMERRKMELKRQMENPRARPRAKTATRKASGTSRGRTTARTTSPAATGARRKKTTASKNGASANGRTPATGRPAARRTTTTRSASRTGSARAGGARTTRTASTRASGTTSTRAKTASSTRKSPARAASRSASRTIRKATTTRAKPR